VTEVLRSLIMIYTQGGLAKPRTTVHYDLLSALAYSWQRSGTYTHLRNMYVCGLLNAVVGWHTSMRARVADIGDTFEQQDLGPSESELKVC